MDEIYTVLDKYYSTLEKTGYLPEKTLEDIFVFEFLTELMTDPDYVLLATCEQQDAACKLYHCVIKNNCLL